MQKYGLLTENYLQLLHALSGSVLVLLSVLSSVTSVVNVERRALQDADAEQDPKCSYSSPE